MYLIGKIIGRHKFVFVLVLVYEIIIQILFSSKLKLDLLSRKGVILF